jgi:hypothetical protein
MTKDLNIIVKILEALETHSTNVRGVRGYGPGTHPHFGTDSPRTVGNRTNLGSSKYAEEELDEETEDDSKVKVSRAFENEE